MAETFCSELIQILLDFHSRVWHYVSMPSLLIENKDDHFLLSAGLGTRPFEAIAYSHKQAKLLPPEEKKELAKYKFISTSSELYFPKESYRIMFNSLFSALLKRKEVRGFKRICNYLIIEGILPPISRMIKDGVENANIEFFFGNVVYNNPKAGCSDVGLFFSVKFNHPKYKNICQKIRIL